MGNCDSMFTPTLNSMLSKVETFRLTEIFRKKCCQKVIAGSSRALFIDNLYQYYCKFYNTDIWVVEHPVERKKNSLAALFHAQRTTCPNLSK